MSVPPSARPALALTISHREFVGLMASCMAMAALSIDLMLPAFPEMRAEFGMPPGSTQITWIITGFFLGLAGGQLLYGPLSDRYGRKPLLYAGLLLMIVSAAAAAVAPTFAVMMVCRVAWGMGAAGPRSLALAMVRDVYSGERMARTMSHVMATFLLVPVLAPSVGAAILEFAPWRSLLWIPAVAAVVLAIWARRLPETLPPDRRRATSPGALVQAAGEVVRSRSTVGFAIALTCLIGIITSFVGGSEVIIDEVFGRSEQFPLIFGGLAIFIAAGAVLNARIVVQIGMRRVLRGAALYLVAITGVMAVVATITDGVPPLWLFTLTMAAVLPATSVLTPNCNTAAMMPLPHVAGTAAAILGTVSTAGGALLGSVIDARFDGTVRPFAFGLLLYAAIATTAIFLLGLRSLPAAPPLATGVVTAAAED